MNHLERGGATVYDDGFAICAEIYSSAGNGLLLRDLERFVDIERPPCQPDRLWRSQSFCPAPDAAQLFFNVMVASEAPVRLHISITVTTGRS